MCLSGSQRTVFPVIYHSACAHVTETKRGTAEFGQKEAVSRTWSVHVCVCVKVAACFKPALHSNVVVLKII